MKKTAIALATVVALATSVAEAAPKERTFYIGQKAGWSALSGSTDAVKLTEGKVEKNSVTYGLYAGYQLSKNVAVELGYDYFGRLQSKDSNDVTDFKHTAHGSHFTIKGNYPISSHLDFYARAGAALVHNNYKFDVNSAERKENNTRVSPVAAAGFEYSFASAPELAFRVEYQYVNRVGKLKDVAGYKPNAHSVTTGLSFRFGQQEQPKQVQMMNVSKTFALNSDVTFGFNNANLQPGAQDILDSIYSEIEQITHASIAVNGYTDRIGSDEANQKLSELRAVSVASYLQGKGVSKDVISVSGKGKSSPVTGNACDHIKGRSALVACLAPDRRVEVKIRGRKPL